MKHQERFREERPRYAPTHEAGREVRGGLKPILSPTIEGTNAHGDSMIGSYKQPWIEHDPTEPDKPEENIG